MKSTMYWYTENKPINVNFKRYTEKEMERMAWSGGNQKEEGRREERMIPWRKIRER